MTQDGKDASSEKQANDNRTAETPTGNTRKDVAFVKASSEVVTTDQGSQARGKIFTQAARVRGLTRV
jgi:hypothetical protein